MIEEDESYKPVSRELWYIGQKAMADTIKELNVIVKETMGNLKLNTEATIKIAQEVTDLKENSIEIKTQTQKTNGRVTALEKREQFNRGALFIIGLILVPIGIYFTERYINHRLDQALSTINQVYTP